MEVSGQLHASAAVLLVKQPLVRMVEEAGLDAMTVDNFLPLPGIKPLSLVVQPLA
jgi:hypothetical protein